MKSLRAFVAIASAIFVLAGCASNKQASVAVDGIKPYPLKKCLVMGDKLDKDAYVFVYQGQQIKLCCEGCKDDFNKDPQKFLKKLAAK